MKAGLVGSIILFTVGPCAAAASPFDRLVPTLQSILECEKATFPRTKNRSAELRKFAAALTASGATARQSGEGAETVTSYRFPKKVQVFGIPVDYVDNLDAPLVSITFAIPAAELLKAIGSRGNRDFRADATPGGYEQSPMYRIDVEGQRFPVEYGISIFKLSKNRSAYICNYRTTDPDAGG